MVTPRSQIVKPSPSDLLAEIDAAPLECDPCHVWMEDHPEELVRYAGERVLIHPTRGVLAHGTIQAVHDVAHQLAPADRAAVLVSAVPA